YGTYVRRDRVHTSYVAGIASMDPRLLTFQLRPGHEDPGPATWGYAPYLPAGSRNGLLATFNGGFNINQAGGGFYLNGITRGTLTRRAASMVYYRDGRVAIGVWGRDVRMTPQVLGVRQNLKPIVDRGVVPASVDQNVLSQWGATLGGGYEVWRSGVGVTRDGRVVFVYGPALSVRTLADLLQRAGAVEAMQLDINPTWMSYMSYRPTPNAADPTPGNLLPTPQEPANRYSSINTRDFPAVFARCPRRSIRPAPGRPGFPAGYSGRWPWCGPPALGSGRRTCWCSLHRWPGIRSAGTTARPTPWSPRPRFAPRRWPSTRSTMYSTWSGTGGSQSRRTRPWPPA